MYDEIGALEPGNGMIPQYVTVFIHYTEHATSNRKHFYSGHREDLLSHLALILEEKNNLAKFFPSLRNLIQINGIQNDVKLVIHVHEKTMPGCVRTYMIPEESEVGALVVGEQHGKLDIILGRRSEFDVDGYEKIDFINLGNRIYDPLAYPLHFPHGNDGW